MPLPDSNELVARSFDQLADLLAMESANPFRIRAYHSAAAELRRMSRDVAEMDAHGVDLAEIPGIGEDLAEKIHEIVTTGRLQALDEIHVRLPASLHELLDLPDLGPKRVATLHRELGVDSLAALRAALVERRVRELPGFGPKSEEKLLALLEQIGPGGDRVSLARVRPRAMRLEAALAAVEGVKRVVVAGSYRRARPTVGDLDILVVAHDDRAIDMLPKLIDVDRVLASGKTKATAVLRGGLQVDIRVVPPQSFGAALHYFTGNKAHNIAVRQRARARGLKLNEYGVFRGRRRVAGETEESVFACVGLPWIAPEMREQRGEIEAAERGMLPRPVESADLVTDLVRPASSTQLEALVDASRRAGRGSLIAVWPTDEALPGRARWSDDLLLARETQLSQRARRRQDAPLVVMTIPAGTKPDAAARTMATVRPQLVSFPATFGLRGDEAQGWLDVFEQLRRLDAAVLAEASPELLPSLEIVLQTAKETGVSVMLASGATTPGGLDTLDLAVGQARRAWLEDADVLNTLDARQLRCRWSSSEQ